MKGSCSLKRHLPEVSAVIPKPLHPIVSYMLSEHPHGLSDVELVNHNAIQGDFRFFG